MSDNKKYYYMKLKDTFFDSEEMKILGSQKNGVDYQLFYMKICLLSLKNGGALLFKEMIPYDIDMLSSSTCTNIDTVKTALEIFRKIGLIDVLDNETIYLTDIQSLVGHTNTEAQRKKAYREKIKENHNNETKAITEDEYDSPDEPLICECEIFENIEKTNEDIEKISGDINGTNADINGTLSQKRPPESESEIDSESEREKELEIDSQQKVFENDIKSSSDFQKTVPPSKNSIQENQEKKDFATGLLKAHEALTVKTVGSYLSLFETSCLSIADRAERENIKLSLENAFSNRKFDWRDCIAEAVSKIKKQNIKPGFRFANFLDEILIMLLEGGVGIGRYISDMERQKNHEREKQAVHLANQKALENQKENADDEQLARELGITTEELGDARMGMVKASMTGTFEKSDDIKNDIRRYLEISKQEKNNV